MKRSKSLVYSHNRYRLYAVTSTEKWASYNVLLSPEVYQLRLSSGLPDRLVYLNPGDDINGAVKNMIEKFSIRTANLVISSHIGTNSTIYIENENEEPYVLKLLAFWANDDGIRKFHKAIDVLELLGNQIVIYTFQPEI